MSSINRKEFIKKSAAAMAGGIALSYGCGNAEEKPSAAVSGKTYEWVLVTAWPPHFPILGDAAEKFAKSVEVMSNRRMKIKVYGGGELIPALETFDAVSQGMVQMGHSASYYWAGKSPVAQIFTAVPFGMNTTQTYSWLYYGGGLDLWKELYAKFNLVPFPAGNTGGQMGGWFNKEINSVSDLKGLKMRIPGFGGNIIQKAGGSAILSPGGEIYTNLERGVIDAAEWIGPYHDWLMGFHKISKYYYYPSFAEPTGMIELIVNKSAYESLPEDLKEIILQASSAVNNKSLAEFDAKNTEYLEKIKNETRVQVRQFPEEVTAAFKHYASEVLGEIRSKDELSARILGSYSKFQERIKFWAEISDKLYYY